MMDCFKSQGLHQGDRTDRLLQEFEEWAIQFFKDSAKEEQSSAKEEMPLDHDGMLDFNALLREKEESSGVCNQKIVEQTKTPKYIEVTTKSLSSDMDAFLDAYQKRLEPNVRDAELYEDINITPLTSAKAKAVIDWFDLRFTVDPMMCSFAYDPKARSYIKAFLTRHIGIKHYVAPDEEDITQEGMSFTIRLHDVHNKKDLNQITELLCDQYGARYESMTVEAIELSLDLYGGDSSAMVIKLHKAMKYPPTSKLLRVYKTKGTQRSIPTSMHQLYDLLEDGYNIGMGDHRVDDFCTRLYFKRVDKGGLPLPKEKHRARIEVTLRKAVFDSENVDRRLSNLQEILSFGFKKMQFTKLSNRSTNQVKDIYFTKVKAFGMEQSSTLSKSRHQRSLPESIKANADVNQAKGTAVKVLVKKF